MSAESDKVLYELGEIRHDIGELDGKVTMMIAESAAINVRIALHDKRIQMCERVVFGGLLVLALLGAIGYIPGGLVS